MHRRFGVILTWHDKVLSLELMLAYVSMLLMAVNQEVVEEWP
jgi:hypothetical protein